MKKIQLYIAGALLPIALGSCNDSFNANNSLGEGRVILRTSVNTELRSRAVDTEALSESCLVWISSEKGLVRKYEGLSNIPAQGVWLVGGNYVAEAWAGDSVPASFDARYFYGREPFEIAAGQILGVDLTCKIRNVVVSVNYGDGVDGALTNKTLTVGHSCGELSWTDENVNDLGYFMMNSRDKNLHVVLSGTKQNGDTYTLEKTIVDAQPSSHYTININYEGGEELSFGGAFFSIEIEEESSVDEDNIQIISAPRVVGGKQELDKEIICDEGNVGRQYMYVAGYSPLASVVLDAPGLEDYLGIGGSDVDLLNCSESITSTLAAAGLITFRYTDAEAGTDDLKIVFEEELLNKLPVGNYNFTVTATDSNGKVGRGTLKIIVSNALVATTQLDANSPNIWAREATLEGTIMKEGIETVGFNYREAGSSDWTYVAAEPVTKSRSLAVGGKFTATIKDLTPGTKYEYVAVTEGYTASVCIFETDSPAQLPNAGFENWYKDGKVWLPCSSADTGIRFWDSGNHGSATMNKNVTNQDSSIKHEGEYSVKLSSQFVGVGSMGKFAAGNIFIGQYLNTVGTDGELGFGRPFTTRPKALKAYVKYNPVAITSEAAGYAKGDMDRGIIYMALLDNSGIQGAEDGDPANYKNFPVIIKTKTKKLFDKTKADVVAYGEKIFTEATSGEGLIEITIPFDYMRNDVRPSYIMLTASASMGGDYFAGGNGSTMYLDDLELVY